ncbi:MAG: hypothetical protein GTO02_17500, partial [Candidatus Dadabacteria bacterium]|nr:hypothetical protein [Candidatus Dadabacteria bacterium]
MSKKVGKIVGVKPTGIQILIEHLTAQEASGSSIVVGENADIGAPQAYVLAIGPGLEEERDKLGFKVGDRVVVQGKYIPLPKPEGQKRELGVIDHVNIKAV